MKRLNEMKKVLRTEKDHNLKVEQLQKARVLYIEQAKSDFKDKKFTVSRLMLKVLQQAFIDFLKQDQPKDLTETKDFIKSVFVQERGYNAQISEKLKDGTYNNLVSVKFYSESDILSLIDDYGFILR